MDDLRVWAPSAARVEVALGGRRRPLAPAAGGWWSLGEGLAPGTDYAFVLDGAGPFPDPRSRWQPAGVHGPSRVDDPGAFRWTDRGWSAPPLADGVLYELHVGTFTPAGTFDAAVERLDALVALGVTHVELMPVAEASGERGWGYDGVGLYAAHHAYGGPAGLRRLVDACHARGLAVLLDVVHNHLGPEGNYLPRFGPYFHATARTPWGAALNLDGPGSAEVRRYLLDSARAWLCDFHLDGLRLDAVHALHDRSPEHLLRALGRETEELARALGRRLVLVAETNVHDPRSVAPRAAGGHGLDAQWVDDLHHAVHAVLTGERAGHYRPFGTLAQVAEALRRGFVAHAPPAHAPVAHPTGDPAAADPDAAPDAAPADPAPAVALPPAPLDRFVGYLQNHDQVGNRLGGERLAQLVGAERARAAAAVLFCAPCVPLLFQGEEWGASTPFLFFCDHRDPWLGDAVRDGRWRELGEPAGVAREAMPDPQAAETLARSRLRWEERDLPAHARELVWHQALVRLRRERADLRDGDPAGVRVTFDEAGRWLVLARARTAVAWNLADAPRALPLPALPGAPRLLLASREGAALGDGVVTVPGGAAAVVGV